MAKAKTSTKKKTKSKVRKAGNSNGQLPRWDLSHLVSAPAAKNVEKGLDAQIRAALRFRKSYEGKVAKLSPAAFGKAIAEYEAIYCRAGRFSGYAFLDRQTKLEDAGAGKLAQMAMEKGSDLSTQTLFFTLEINKLADAAFRKLLSDKKVKKYKPWLDAVRQYRPHQLHDEAEKAVHEREVVGHPAWSRLFDEVSARMRFEIDGKQLTQTDVLHMFSDRDPKVRKKAALAFGKGLSKEAPTFGLILNTIAKEREIDDRQRKFKTPVAFRNLANEVEDDVVEALVKAVRASHPRLSHRYYKLKAKWMGKKTLETWDRNAPLPFSAEKTIPWGAARESVLGAYGDFHPEMARIAKRFFDEKWIDAAPYAGKDSGAFSAGMTPDTHPYILMNYKGRVNDVMTLAHELGHGIHQSLSGPQGYLMADTSLPLAETASVFGEMLTFRAFLRNEKNPSLRRAVIAKKVEDMLNTVVRQVAFHDFETAFHTERRKGEVTPDRICEIWLDVQKKSLGPAFRFDEDYKYYWAYIGHFYHVPFYVYAYAFGDCLVNALYAVYEDKPQGFAEKYIGLLSAGGTKRHAELLKPFGLDARDAKFWKKGLSVIEGLIDELE